VSVRSTRNDEKHIKYAMKALDKIYIIYTCYRIPHIMSSDQKHNTNIDRKFIVTHTQCSLSTKLLRWWTINAGTLFQ
jgi:hypothetical protein